MIAGVADTHAALWYLLGSPRLSAHAREFMDTAASAGNTIALSTIKLASRKSSTSSRSTARSEEHTSELQSQ